MIESRARGSQDNLFDNANRLTQISQGSANVSFGYDNDSRRTSLTLPNGVALNYGYDAASQLTGITYMLGTNTLGNLTYSYDLAGRRTGVGGTYARANAPAAATSASYNVNNQLTNWKGATLQYDANGNLTSDGTNTYNWNARNQLVTISGAVSATFQYDPFGRRVSKTIGGVTQFLYDGVNPVQEISGTTASANLLTGGVDEYFQRTDPAGARSFLTDAIGSTLALTDSTGTVQASYTFEPFGNTAVSGATTTNSFAYTGRELDATGLYFNRARYYHPQLQRFISEDPIGLRAGPNAYVYANQNPASLTDPLGLESGATLKLDNDNLNSGPLSPMFPFAGRKGPDRVNAVNRCAASLSQEGSASAISSALTGGRWRIPGLLGSNTAGDIAGLLLGPEPGTDSTVGTNERIDQGLAVGAEFSKEVIQHAVLEAKTGWDLVNIARTGLLSFTPETIGATTIGGLAGAALEGAAVGKALLDAGVYIGALVVCAQE